MEETSSITQEQENIEAVTIQPSSETQVCWTPSTCSGFMVLPFLMMALWLFFVIFFTVMVYKFVKATERIANKFEEGIKIQKDT